MKGQKKGQKGLYLEENHLGSQLLISRDLTYCWAQSAFFLYNILKYLGSQNEPIIIIMCKCREEPIRKKERKKLSKGSDYSAVAEQHYPPHLLNCNRKILERQNSL